MKRTVADRSGWRRITQRRFKLTYINDNNYKGYLSILYLDKVKEPLFVVDENNLCIVDDGYVWTQYFPEGKNYALTAQFNDKHELIQLYYDVCNGNKINEAGIPYYDDLYLDVILLSTKEVMLLDEDELQKALYDKKITKKQYDLAYRQAYELIELVKKNGEKQINDSIYYMNYINSLNKDC